MFIRGAILTLLLASLSGEARVFEGSSLVQSPEQICASLSTITKHSGIDLRSYTVSGSNLDELREEIRKRGPADENLIRYDAYTHWRVWWNWETTNGMADLNTVKVNISGYVLVPELADPTRLSATEIAAWNRYKLAMGDHELVHVINGITLKKRLVEFFHNKLNEKAKWDPKGLNREAEKLIHNANVFDKWFDSLTEHGKADGVYF